MTVTTAMGSPWRPLPGKPDELSRYGASGTASTAPAPGRVVTTRHPLGDSAIVGNPGHHPCSGHGLEIVGADVLPDWTHRQRHRHVFSSGRAGAGHQGLGRHRRAQVQTGYEQTQTARWELSTPWQVDENEIMVRAQRLQGGADGRREAHPAAPVPGQDGHAEPGGQNRNEAIGTENRLIDWKVTPMQAGNDAVADEQAETAGWVGIQDCDSSTSSGAGACEVEQECARAQAATSSDERNDSGARRMLRTQQSGNETIGAIRSGQRIQSESTQMLPARALADGGVGQHVRTAQKKDGAGVLQKLDDGGAQVAGRAQRRTVSGTGADKGEDIVDLGRGQVAGQRPRQVLRHGLGPERMRNGRGGRGGPGRSIGRAGKRSEADRRSRSRPTCGNCDNEDTDVGRQWGAIDGPHELPGRPGRSAGPSRSGSPGISGCPSRPSRPDGLIRSTSGTPESGRLRRWRRARGEP